MVQAVRTTYHGPGNVHGSYISAKASAGTARHGYDHALTLAGNHLAAARKLCQKYGWTGTYVAGGSWDGDYYWVCVDDRANDGSFTL